MKKYSTIFLCALMICLKVNSQIKVQKIENPPVIDGLVNDEIWGTEPQITDFLQREPNEGQPLTEKTDVYIAYSADAIYFGVKCFQDPKSISAKEMQRGAPLENDDRIHIILDTHLDGRNAYFFEINALGSIGDGLISENGRKLNIDWDGLFTGKSQITSDGWEAELEIPFKTLSFNPEKDSWGLFMNRMLEKKQEWGSWPVANVNMLQMVVSDAGFITGLDGISQGVGLDIVPFLVTGYDHERGEDPGYKADIGTDIYYQVTPKLKASLSVNTDFAEIEADSREINLSRFNIRLKEKRHFFLDGADLFSFGLDNRRIEPPSGKINPFFSRRLGIDNDGQLVPINFAAKMAGRIENWDMGLMHVNENREDGVANSSVANFSYNFGQLSSIGMIATHGNTITDSSNFVTGLDLNLSTSKFLGDKQASIVMYGLKSTTDSMKGNDVAWGAILNYPNDLIIFQLGHQQIGDKFFSGLGFVPRTNIREYWGKFYFEPRINTLGIRQISMGGSFDYVTNFSDKMQSQSLDFTPFSVRLNSGGRFGYSVSYITENLDEDFNIFKDNTIPMNNYNWWEHDFSIKTSGSRLIHGGLKYETGKFYTGSKNSFKPELYWKIIKYIFLGAEASFDYVTLPESNFLATTYEFNMNFLFSPDITLYNLIQYDNESEKYGYQTRFRWILKPGNEILLAWNSGYTLPGERFKLNENSFRFKIKYNIRF